MLIPRGDAVALTRALIRVDSRNPSLVPDGPGENGVARLLAEVLHEWGMSVDVIEVLPGRPNVIATTGRGDGRSLMFNGHLDVVGVTGMTHDPFDPVEVDGRIQGRGAADMKAGIAAMAAAAVRAESQLGGRIVVAAVIDEEFTSRGTRALLERGVRTDGAIVGEPTGLAIMPAHKGFVWLDVEVAGRAAHGSRWDLGVDAIRNAGLFLSALDAYDREILPSRTHRLLGRASVHASAITGGSGMSTYPDRCTISIERRTLPGESAATVLTEIQGLCDWVRTGRPDFDATVRVGLAQPPSDLPASASIVRELAASLESFGLEPRVEGMSAWTDAALLNEAGIPATCFGPGDIGLAHSAEEWVERREIEEATQVLAELARRWTSE